jgi:serine/threonine protein kinase
MCENTTLDALLGGMSELEVNLAMFDLAEGLRYLHEEARVLHRNIRGQSVLMRGCRYLISDFSEAEVLAAGARIRGLAGKKYCMSPEMLAEQPYDFPSDIWALGILFAELMVGIPFRTMENKIAALLSDFPESFLPRISESWKK